ncbi:MAG: DUF4338 domain-containing protein [Deltaproteobacteria bacterium]|nr:DUF4338 domain-containing protein [Deltaproteobacteria bacterium]
MDERGPWRLPALRAWLARLVDTGPSDELGAAAAGLPTAASRAAARVALDLAAAGWSIGQSEGGPPTLQRPEGRGGATEDAHRRAELARARRAQLAEPATRAFVERMERSQLFGGDLRSVFDLMRDGAALERQLAATGADPGALLQVVRPCVEVVHPGARCAHTGLLLSDVWRYFRHGWATPYRSSPGRGLAVLIRDAAAPFAPVMGIGLLASAPAQLRARDRWIGWEPADVLTECRSAPTGERAAWLCAALREELSEVYLQDLLEDGIIAPTDLVAPTSAALRSLRAEALAAAAAHRRYGGGATEHGRGAQEPVDWERQARTPLYRAKRAALLAALLGAQRAVAGLDPSPAGLGAFAATADGARAITALARRAKARRLGACIAELAVCGAVAPYRALLGGKLIAALMAGAEVRAAWERRYGEADAQVASPMAGRPVQRGGTLGLIGTTSLYGPGAQYNRAEAPQHPCDGGPPHLARYRRIGATRGYGTSHLSPATREALAQLVAEARGGARPTSRMGEGVSPRLRVAREGLELLGLDADALLQHGAGRAIYVVELGAAARPWLRGEAEDPLLYAAPEAGARGRAATEATARYWLERWVAPRLGRPELRDELARHSHARPSRHGARVVLPEDEP